MPSRQFQNRSMRTHPLPYASRSLPSYRPALQPVASRSLRPKRRLLVLAILALSLFFSVHGVVVKHAAAETIAAKQAAQEAAALKSQRVTTFDNQFAAVVAANPGVDFSVSIVDSDNQVHTEGVSTSFDGASTAKLLTAVDYLHHVEQHQASLGQSIDGQSARQLLQAMIVNSDDTAWLTLNDYLTHPDLANYAAQIGFQAYDPTDNTMTSSDIALLMHKLYVGNILNTTDRSLLLSYLGRANYRDFIVAAVPTSDHVYHKIGIDGDSVHDAAIITSGKQAMTIVIFTDGHGTYNWDQRAAAMQAITKDALTAFLPTP